MKNEYDALNRASMELEQYEQEPVSAARQAALVEMLRRAGGPGESAAAKPGAGQGRRRWAVLAVAAVLACGALGVGAASRFEWGKEFTAFLGVAQEQAETLGVPGVGLGITKALGGGTVTVEGVLGDDHCVYIPLRVELPAGTEPAQEGYGFDRFTFTCGEANNSGMAVIPLWEEGSQNRELKFVLMAHASTNLSGKTAELVLGNLFAYPCTPQQRQANALLPGTVVFDFRLDYQTQAVRVPVAAGGTDVGAGVSLERVELSPLSLYLGFEDGPSEGFDSGAMLEMPVALHLANGTVMPLRNSADGSEAGQGMRYAGGPRDAQLVCQFGTILDLAEVESVEINGRLFPLGKQGNTH